MILRCYDPDNQDYKYYGARGIKVCDAWFESFESFEQYEADIGKCPGPTFTLDRKNNNGDYEPGNVRWATKTEQALNRRGWAASGVRYLNSRQGKFVVEYRRSGKLHKVGRTVDFFEACCMAKSLANRLT